MSGASSNSQNSPNSHSYPYYKNIKSPSQIGMTDHGSLSALGKDIDGLMAYVEVLVSGKSKASKTGRPLGNKYFVDTKSSCKDTSTGKVVPRHFYVNNVPMGNIPFISEGMGEDFTSFRGLLPGVISNLNVLDPRGLVSSFTESGTPDCAQLTMETIDNSNQKSSETNYVILSDIKRMDPCWFSTGENPVTHERCSNHLYKQNKSPAPFSSEEAATKRRNRKKKDGFTIMSGGSNETFMSPTIPNDPVAQAYFTSLGILLIYIIYKCSTKRT